MSLAEQLAESIIAPIVRWVEAERGRKSALVRTIQEAAGDSAPTRNVIEAWIHPDKSQRKNPTLPNGLLLISAAVAAGAIRASELPKWKAVLDGQTRKPKANTTP